MKEVLNLVAGGELAINETKVGGDVLVVINITEEVERVSPLLVGTEKVFTVLWFCSHTY